MRLTREHLAAAFPVIELLPANAGTDLLRQVIARHFAGFTDNIDYAADLATVVVSHMADGLYSALPYKLQCYRASVDSFLEVADEDKITTYIRAIARACAFKRMPRNFHQALLAAARQHDLTIPEHMLAGIKEPPTRIAHVRIPLPVHGRLKAEAKATGVSVAEIIRERILDRDKE